MEVSESTALCVSVPGALGEKRRRRPRIFIRATIVKSPVLCVFVRLGKGFLGKCFFPFTRVSRKWP